MISAVSSEAPRHFVDTLEQASELSASGDLREGCHFDGLFGKTNTLSQEQKDSFVSSSPSPSCSPSSSSCSSPCSSSADLAEDFSRSLNLPINRSPFPAEPQLPEECQTRQASATRHEDYSTLMKLFEIDEHASFRSPLHAVSRHDLFVFTFQPTPTVVAAPSPFPTQALAPLRSELESEFCQKHADDSFQNLIRRFHIDPHSSHVSHARPLYLPSPFPYASSSPLLSRSSSVTRSRSVSGSRSSLKVEVKPRRVRRCSAPSKQEKRQRRRWTPAPKKPSKAQQPSFQNRPAHFPKRQAHRRPVKSSYSSSGAWAKQPSRNLQAHRTAQSELRNTFVHLKRNLLSHLPIQAI